MTALVVASDRVRDPDAIRRVVEATLAQPEFGSVRQEKGWLEKLLDDFVEWLDGLFGGAGAAGEVALVALYVAAGALVLLLVVSLVRRILARAPRERPAADGAVLRAQRVRELLARARAARARGELLDALRLHFWALVIGLSERGDLEYRDAWTNRELLERGRPRPDAAALLAPLVPRLDAQSFGREPVVEADVERLAELCRAHLRSAELGTEAA